VLGKVRLGDRRVEISLPSVEGYRDRTPVVVDDIVSSATTMAETVSRLRDAGLAAPVCVAVHALSSGEAEAALLAAGASRLVTTNTVPHRTNAIDIVPLLAAAVRDLVSAAPRA
jgi:ribose-phosphate pyrophosphokinase